MRDKIEPKHAQKQDRGAVMKHASSRQVFEYWNERRGQRLAPERSEIEPGPIRRVLGDTFILERDGYGAYHFRLAGTRLCALFCRELRGTDFLNLWPAAERRDMQTRLRTAVHESAGFVAGVTGRNAMKVSTDLEMLILPLRHPARDQARLLGVLAALAPPYWLGTLPIEDLACGSFRHLTLGSVASPRLVPGSESARLRRGLVIYDGGRS
jgi:hypothetical protein